jgi:hypothetical protein
MDDWMYFTLMALMAHQLSLILQFLLPQTSGMVDPSCRFQTDSVWASSKPDPSKGTDGILLIW